MNKLINKIEESLNKLSEENDTELIGLYVQTDLNDRVIQIPYLLILNSEPCIRVIDYIDENRMTGWYSLDYFKKVAKKYNLREKKEK